MTRYKFKKHFAMLSAAVTMMLAQSAFAAETVELKLDDALQRAFATNPAISMANYDLNSARAGYNAARNSRYISISGSHKTGRGGNDDYQPVRVFDDETQTFATIQSKGIENSHTTTLTASMPIYTGGRIQGSIKQAKAKYLTSKEDLQLAYNDMHYTVTNAYYTMLHADNSQKLSREAVARLQDHLKNVQAQYDVGVVAKVDLLRSQVELSDAEQELIKAENAYQVAEANLNRIVGLPMDTELKLDSILNYTAYDNDMAYCLDYAASHRPELEKAKQGVEAAKGALRVAISDHMPQVTASASQNWKDKDWPGDKNGNWSVGVSVSMNIFDSGVTTSKIHGAEANLAKAHEKYRDTVDAVNLDVRTVYLNLREAEKRITSTSLALETAQEDYRIAKLRYENGVGTNTDVLDAQVALTKAQNNYSKALYDYNISKISLENAIGVPMTVPVKVNA